MTVEDRDFNPALDLPLRNVPFTLVGIFPIGHIFYFEFDSEPPVEDYVQAGAKITRAMVKAIGRKPASWYFAPSADVNLGFFQGGAGPEPVRVV